MEIKDKSSERFSFSNWTPDHNLRYIPLGMLRIRLNQNNIFFRVYQNPFFKPRLPEMNITKPVFRDFPHLECSKGECDHDLENCLMTTKCGFSIVEIQNARLWKSSMRDPELGNGFQLIVRDSSVQGFFSGVALFKPPNRIGFFLQKYKSPVFFCKMFLRPTRFDLCRTLSKV